jgi:hypothetical protein
MPYICAGLVWFGFLVKLETVALFTKTSFSSESKREKWK